MSEQQLYWAKRNGVLNLPGGGHVEFGGEVDPTLFDEKRLAHLKSRGWLSATQPAVSAPTMSDWEYRAELGKLKKRVAQLEEANGKLKAANSELAQALAAGNTPDAAAGKPAASRRRVKK